MFVVVLVEVGRLVWLLLLRFIRCVLCLLEVLMSRCLGSVWVL